MALESVLTPLAGELEALARGLQASLVTIRSSAGGGSGTAWRDPETVVTNHHVVPAETAEVVPVDGGRALPAIVIARDPALDLALLRVEGAELQPATPADSDQARTGQLAFAVGNPWGQRGYLTAGIILGRGPASVENRVPLEDAIRADLRLAPGNSGGPMADARGQVIGINSMIAGGIAIAVPSNEVEAFAGGSLAPKGRLGVVARAVELPSAMAASYPTPDGAGLMVTGIEPHSPAEAAGLLPGDIVLGLDGQRTGLVGMARQLERLRAGRPVRVSVLRGGRPAEVEAVPVAV